MSSRFITVFAALALIVSHTISPIHAQLNTSCKNDTIWDIMSSDPDMSIVATGTQNNNGDIFLGDPNVNATVFVPTKIATVRGMYEYAGITDYENASFGSGLTVLLIAYGVIEGRVSREELLSVPSMNTLMGMINNTDFTIQMSANSTLEESYITGTDPNNIAKVLNVTKACNGYIYTIDQLLRPAALATPVPNRLSYGSQIIQYFYGGNCLVPFQTHVLQNVPQSKQWVSIWNSTEMINLLSNPALSATFFVPQDKGVLAAGSAARTADTVMYNMIRGNWCPGELAAAGTKNSMLGEVQGEQIPLTFSNDTTTGDLIITGPLGSARVLNITTSCNNIVYMTDVPLLPPPPSVSAGASAAQAPAPSSLPRAPARHITCNPPIFSESLIDTPDPSKNPAIALEAAAQKAANSRDGTTNAEAAESTDINTDSGTSSNNTELAVGLGVGIGCAVLLGCAAGFILAKRRRQKRKKKVNAKNENSFLTTSSPSDSGAGAKLLPGQSIVNSSVLSNANSLKKSGQYRVSGISDGTGDSIAFAAVSDVFCDSAFTNGNYASKENTNTTTSKASTNETGAGVRATATSDSNSAGNAKTGANNKDGIDLWEVNPEDLQIALDISGQPIELGKGSYGTVYRGTIREVQPAAIKVLNQDIGIDSSAAFWREAAILKHASRDRNVIQLYGTSTLPDGKFLLITELMEYGDLRKALTSKKTTEELVWSRKGKSVSLDIARGITALHAVNVIHRDLKSKNVLLTENFTAKVADMGIAGVHSQGYLTAGAGQVMGTLAWSAPELLLGEKCSEKVDIYSLGVVLWEIGTRGGVPQRGLVGPPPPSKECPAELAVLIKECINPDPSSRPNAKQVYERLLQIPQ